MSPFYCSRKPSSGPDDPIKMRDLLKAQEGLEFYV